MQSIRDAVTLLVFILLALSVHLDLGRVQAAKPATTAAAVPLEQAGFPVLLGGSGRLPQDQPAAGLTAPEIPSWQPLKAERTRIVYSVVVTPQRSRQPAPSPRHASPGSSSVPAAMVCG